VAAVNRPSSVQRTALTTSVRAPRGVVDLVLPAVDPFAARARGGHVSLVSGVRPGNAPAAGWRLLPGRGDRGRSRRAAPWPGSPVVPPLRVDHRDQNGSALKTASSFAGRALNFGPAIARAPRRFDARGDVLDEGVACQGRLFSSKSTCRCLDPDGRTVLGRYAFSLVQRCSDATLARSPRSVVRASGAVIFGRGAPSSLIAGVAGDLRELLV